MGTLITTLGTLHVLFKDIPWWSPNIFSSPENYYCFIKYTINISFWIAIRCPKFWLQMSNWLFDGWDCLFFYQYSGEWMWNALWRHFILALSKFLDWSVSFLLLALLRIVLQLYTSLRTMHCCILNCYNMCKNIVRSTLRVHIMFYLFLLQ